MSVAVVTDLGALDDSTLDAWDALAAATGQPCMLSSWVLGAARHLSDEQEVHVLLLRDGDALVGVAAFQRNRWTGLLPIEAWIQVAWNLGAGHSPLAAKGYESALADAIMQHLAALDVSPSMLTIAWDEFTSLWPKRLTHAWGGRMQHRVETTEESPIVTLATSHDAWLSSKSRHFRQAIKRNQKAIAKRGGIVRRSDDPEQVEQDLAEIWVAHDARFASLGKASGLTDGHRAAVRHAVPRLVPRGHLRVWVIEHNGRVVGGQIHVRAGDAMYFFNGGMTPGWEREGPGMVLLHAAVEDAHGLDARCVDLGPGAFPYKLRFADTIRQVSSHDLFAIDPRYVVTRARLAPKHLAIAARRRFTELPEQRQLAIKRMLRRG